MSDVIGCAQSSCWSHRCQLLLELTGHPACIHRASVKHIAPETPATEFNATSNHQAVQRPLGRAVG